MLWIRGLDGGRRRARAPADVLPVRPADVRSGQARTAMGPGDVGRATGTRVPDVPGGPAGLGRTARPVRVLWRYAAFCDARTGRVPRVRPRPRRACRARLDGRLAQRESASLTRKRSGVQIPQRPPTEALVTGLFLSAEAARWGVPSRKVDEKLTRRPGGDLCGPGTIGDRTEDIGDVFRRSSWSIDASQPWAAAGANGV